MIGNNEIWLSATSMIMIKTSASEHEPVNARNIWHSLIERPVTLSRLTQHGLIQYLARQKPIWHDRVQRSQVRRRAI